MVSLCWTMIQLTCFSFHLDTVLFEAVSAVAQAEQNLLGINNGSKTFSDTFSDISEPDPVKFDVCVTLMLFVPLLFIPNLINQNHDQESKKKPEVIHYTVTPIPPTPPSVWLPHYPYKTTSKRPLPPSPSIIPDILTPFEFQSSTARTSTTTRRTTTTPRPRPSTTTRVTSTTSAEVEEVIPEKEQISLLTPSEALTLNEERFSSDLWVDVPVSGDLPQPNISQLSHVIERQIQDVRNRYVSMGVPRKYLTKNMIWKLIKSRGGHQDQFHFNSNT